MNPVLLVIAGPNGSGKTTVTVSLRENHWSDGVEYLNPDDIAQEKFGGWNSRDAVLKAAVWTTNRREELLSARKGIAFETVFSAPDKLLFLQRAREAGYFLRVFFVGTESPTINAARVARRVIEGGHSVPIEKIISRFEKSTGNLAVALTIANRVYIYDNSLEGADARLCARTHDGMLRKFMASCPIGFRMPSRIYRFIPSSKTREQPDLTPLEKRHTFPHAPCPPKNRVLRVAPELLPSSSPVGIGDA
ncbi:MAG: AAA family ATPase [Pleurocapsa sp. SU_196_0]|nr:AAA family ATPase [Pleurocapsa sp. SU_196_0]